MSQAPKRIHLDEQAARRLTLVRAIETSDSQGKLLNRVERDKIDGQALQYSSKGPAVAAFEAFLKERGQQILRLVESRNPALASLQAQTASTQRFAVVAFLAAIIFGAATDRIANPHRVDLLSLPLLTLIVWNLVIYCLLVAGYIVHRAPQPDAQRAPALFIRWADGLRAWRRPSGMLRADVTAVFMRNWYGLTAGLHAQRLRKILHLAAAGWALGLALSLFTRGLVVEYRVGWESTFLDASQVHAILRVLLMPVVALFPFQPFTVQDIANLRFNNGSGAMAGARWVYIYVTLLAVVVILPRLALACYAGWRERALSSRIAIELKDPYYQRLLAMLNPTRIQLGLLAFRDHDRDALLRVLRQRSRTLDISAAAEASPQILIRNSNGEALWIANITAANTPQLPSQRVNASPPTWTRRMLGRLSGARVDGPALSVDNPLQMALDDSDVMLLVVRDADDLESARPLFPSPAKPVLLLINPPATAASEREAAIALCSSKVRALGLQVEALSFDRFARCWVQDAIFLHALARCVPGPKRETFARLTDAWLKRNDALFSESMQLIATQLVDAAREVEEVKSALPYFKRLTSLADRQADAQARQHATAAVAERLRQSAQKSHLQLLRLHGIDDAKSVLLAQPQKANFDFQAPINATEAGLAGAATGAASGASIDLVTGGLTLGMATALGALIGGGAAFAGAAWKNRATPTGTTLVQLNDEMLQATAAAALLRYLAMVDLAPSANATECGESAALWESKLVMAVDAKKESFIRYWADARAQQSASEATSALGGELQKIMRPVLDELYLRNRS